jgi:hypothetical protein
MEIRSNVKIFSQLLNNKKKKKSNNNNNKKMGCYPQRQSSNWCSGESSLQHNDFKFICCCLFCPVFCPNSWALFLVPNPRIFQLSSIKAIRIDTYLGPILNSQHVFEEHHVPSTAASDAFGGELADAGAFLADVGCNLAGCTVMGLIVMKSS